MKTRTTRVTLTHSEGVFEVEIVDEGVGEYVMVSCGLDRPPFEQRISIGPSEWPFLRDAIDRMFVEIAEHESEKKIKELLETPAPWDTSGASGEEQAEPSAEAPQGARTSEPSESEADGWIPWNGGECPVSKKSHVAVRLRAASFPGIHIARDLRWEWAGPKSPWGWEPENDIIAYKVVD